MTFKLHNRLIIQKKFFSLCFRMSGDLTLLHEQERVRRGSKRLKEISGAFVGRI